MNAKPLSMELFERWVSVARDWYSDMVPVSLSLLALCFVVTIYLAYYHDFTGSYSIGELLKRLVVSVLLITFFVDVTGGMMQLSDEMLTFIDRSGGQQEFGFAYLFQLVATHWEGGTLFKLIFENYGAGLLFLITFFIVFVGHLVINSIYYAAFSIFIVLGAVLNVLYVIPSTSQVAVTHFMRFVKLAIFKMILYFVSAVMIDQTLVEHYAATEPNYWQLSGINVLLTLSIAACPVLTYLLITNLQNIARVLPFSGLIHQKALSAAGMTETAGVAGARFLGGQAVSAGQQMAHVTATGVREGGGRLKEKLRNYFND